MSNIVQLDCAGASARLVPEAGGRVSALRLMRPGGGVVDILHPYPEDFFDPIRWAKGGIYPLMPYSNRIAQATVQVDGEAISLEVHPDAAPHSLHGNAQALAWRLLRSDATSAVMTLDSPASAAWPWHYAGRMHLALMPGELRVEMELRNTDTRTMPAGMGLHPYFRHRPDALLGYRAGMVWPPNAEFLPVAARAPHADEIYEPARSLPAGGRTDYVGGWDGVASVDLPDTAGVSARLRIVADPVFRHLVVHRPDNLAYLCLEPVSHVADGFNLAARGVADTGARLLAPDESMGGAIRFELMGDAT